MSGGYNDNNLGGHTHDNGDGTSTTSDNRGDITHHTPDSSSSNTSSFQGGDGGRDNVTSSVPSVNLTLFPEAQASMVLGAPTTLSLVDGLWGFTFLKSQTIQQAIAEAFAKLKPISAPVAGMLWRGSLWGIVVQAVTPSKIAPDDMSMVPHIFTTLPANMVTKTPYTQLPTQTATLVDARVTDLIQNNQQMSALVSAPSLPLNVPVVAAKPSGRPGVYTASIVHGMPDIHINVGTPLSAAPQKPATNLHEVRNAPLTQQQIFASGGNVSDAIIYFPPEAKTDPIYISVTPVLTVQQIKELQAEFERRQAQWDSGHPVDVAERRLYQANEALNYAQENLIQKQSVLDRIKNTPEGLALADPITHPITSTSSQFLSVPSYSGGGVSFEATATIDTRESLGQLLSMGGAAYVSNVLQWGDVSGPDQDGVIVGNGYKNATIAEYEKLRQQLIASQNEIIAAQEALNSASGTRYHAEQDRNNAESNRDKIKEENKDKPTDFTIDDKIRKQMGKRGWTEQDIRDAVSKGPKGLSVDQRGPKKTPPDFLGRDDSASVYGAPGKYVVINDRTKEVTQVSDKTDPDWADDSRIFWGNQK
ncbi:MAG: colicin-like bacteriocin tRNase domain-containing protein [Ewingella sp.]|uniref:colicin-like bacteriocin tRNase domain-containing protein n=1 Tax=Ewingella TaxID=41201 RepID=UPI0033657C91